MLGFPHDANWVSDKYGYNIPKHKQTPVLAYNNRNPTDPSHMSAVQITPYYLGNDKYARNKDGSFAPKEFDINIEEFFELDKKTKNVVSHKKTSRFVSSIQKLPNGNLVIASGVPAEIVEIKDQKYQIWKFVNPAVPNDDEDATTDLILEKDGELSLIHI